MLAHSSIDRLQGPPLNLLIGRIRDHLTFCAALAEVPKLVQLFLSQLLDSDAEKGVKPRSTKVEQG